mmetsp:Transcript_8789/g.22732  ORF Transcript_8789/g.22732 Transcript_8789/m.22732 type:complete len:207 (-) Transcript_8789:224-844(-)
MMLSSVRTSSMFRPPEGDVGAAPPVATACGAACRSVDAVCDRGRPSKADGDCRPLPVPGRGPVCDRGRPSKPGRGPRLMGAGAGAGGASISISGRPSAVSPKVRSGSALLGPPSGSCVWPPVGRMVVPSPVLPAVGCVLAAGSCVVPAPRTSSSSNSRPSSSAAALARASSSALIVRWIASSSSRSSLRCSSSSASCSCLNFNGTS